VVEPGYEIRPFCNWELGRTLVHNAASSVLVMMDAVPISHLLQPKALLYIHVGRFSIETRFKL
jgi:hypothetical protein